MPLREILSFEGSLQSLQLEQRRQNDLELVTRTMNAARLNLAAGQFSSLLSRSSIMDATVKGCHPGPVPSWIGKVHRSHERLKHAGGIVYCCSCGCVSSSGAGNSHLWRQCKDRIPAGSSGRLTRLQHGKHPHANVSQELKQWPDGRDIESIVHFAPSIWPAQPGQKVAVHIPQQRYFTAPAFQEKPVEDNGQQQIDGVLEDLLENMKRTLMSLHVLTGFSSLACHWRSCQQPCRRG